MEKTCCDRTCFVISYSFILLFTIATVAIAVGCLALLPLGVWCLLNKIVYPLEAGIMITVGVGSWIVLCCGLLKIALFCVREYHDKIQYQSSTHKVVAVETV
jgi:hypothetical protein